MRNFFLIQFNHDVEQSVNWATFDAKGRLLASAMQVPLEQVIVQNSTPIVLIPGTEVLLTLTEIPSKQWQRIVQAVPYALEEQLAEDVEKLHFALGKRDSASNTIAVAVVTKAKMTTYLQRLQSVGIVPTVLIPDVLAVPMPAEGWGILFSNQLALVRTDWQAGFAIEVDNLVKALQLVTSPPQQLVIYNHSPALSQLATLGIPITVVMEEDSEEVVLDWLVQGGLAKHPLNLLQGDYRRQDKWINVWRQWRLTVILLIIFGGLYLANQYSEYRQLVEQYEILTKQLEQVYRDTFPEARKVVNPRVQMEQQLKTLRAANVPTSPIRNIFQLLDKISIPLARTPGFTLKQLDYQAGRLDLQLEVANFQSLEYLKKRLTNLGVTVEILSAVNRNEIVVSRVRISET